MNRKPFRYQIEGAKLLDRFGGRALLADEMGLGKSFTALLYAQAHPELRPAVVVCPASLKWNWRHEITVGTGERSEILEGTKPRKHHVNFKSPFLIVNYDIIPQTRSVKRGPGWLQTIKDIAPKLIIIDEGHYLGNRTSLRTKAIRELSLDVDKILVLSGTPLTNRPAELWPVLNILRPKDYPSFFPFAMAHCKPRRNPWGWDFSGASDLPGLHKKLSSGLMVRRRKSDVLKELPAKRRSVLPLPLSDRKDYDRAVNDFLGWLGDRDPGKVRKAQRAEGLVKLGYLKRLAAELKLPAVIEWVDSFLAESDSKLVLFAIHKKIIASLSERYAKIMTMVDGSVTGKERQRAVEKFQKDPKIRLFIGNVKAAGVGVTLTAASDLAFTEIGWAPGEMVQAEDRIHRIGQENHAMINYLVGAGTIEEDLCSLIRKKQKVLNAVLDSSSATDSFDVFDKLTKILKKQGTQT